MNLAEINMFDIHNIPIHNIITSAGNDIEISQM